MKRLLALTGLTCMSVLTAAFYLGQRTALGILIVFTAGLVLSLVVKSVRKQKVLPVICAVAAVSALFYTVYTNAVYTPLITQYAGKEVAVTAVLQDTPNNSYGYNYYTFKTETVNGKQETMQFTLRNSEKIDMEPYDRIQCTVQLEEAGAYSIAKGTYFTAASGYTFTYRVSETEHKPLYYYAVVLRQKMEQALDSVMRPEYANLTKALLLGDKYALEPEVKEAFRTVGLSHVIVVSGLHLSLLSGYVSLLLKKLTKNKYASAIVSVSLVVLFMAVTGFSVSIVRAGVMVIVYQVGTLLPRQADSLNSIGLAALILLIPNPYAVGDIGMLLSFGATMGIVLWATPCTAYINKKINKFKQKHLRAGADYLAGIISVSICAVTAITPITLLAFGTFSTVVILANILVTPVIGIVLVCGLLVVLFYYLGFLAPVAGGFALFAGIVCKYILGVVELLSKIPFALLYANEDYVYLWLAFTLVLVAVMLVTSKGYQHLKYVISLSALILLAGFVSSYIAGADTAKVTVYNTGDGASVSVSYQNHTAILAASGNYKGKYDLCTQLEYSAGTIDFMAVPCDSADGLAYSREILQRFDVGSVLLYDNTGSYRKIKDYLLNTNHNVIQDNMYTMHLWNGITVTLIQNNGNLYRFVQFGKASMLILPEQGDCSVLPEQYRSPDYLVLTNQIKNIATLRAGTAVICRESGSAAAVANEYRVRADQTVFTCDGDAVFTVN